MREHILQVVRSTLSAYGDWREAVHPRIEKYDGNRFLALNIKKPHPPWWHDAYQDIVRKLHTLDPSVGIVPEYEETIHATPDGIWMIECHFRSGKSHKKEFHEPGLISKQKVSYPSEGTMGDFTVPISRETWRQMVVAAQVSESQAFLEAAFPLPYQRKARTLSEAGGQIELSGHLESAMELVRQLSADGLHKFKEMEK